jgi:hypothetical protein
LIAEVHSQSSVLPIASNQPIGIGPFEGGSRHSHGGGIAVHGVSSHVNRAGHFRLPLKDLVFLRRVDAQVR